MKTRLIFLVAGMLSTLVARADTPAPAATKPDKEKLKVELAKMEDAFCAMTQEKGVLAAFEHFAAPDVAFLDVDPTIYRGLEAVRRRLGPDRPGTKVAWSAMFTDVSDDGTLGYNWGRYEWRSPGNDGRERVTTGYFLTIWKRQPDGTWRYVMDNGTHDAPPPTPAAVPKTEKPTKPEKKN